MRRDGERMVVALIFAKKSVCSVSVDPFHSVKLILKTFDVKWQVRKLSRASDIAVYH